MNKILFITAFPPGNLTAGQNYTAQLLKDISGTYKVDLIYWTYPGHTAILPPEVKVIEAVPLTRFRKLLNSILSFFLFPIFTVRFSWKMMRRISMIAPKYDLIYFDFSQVFMYSLFLAHPSKIFMCHDVISQKYSRKPFSFLYLWFVKFSERVMLKTADLRMCFSDKDVRYMRDEFGLESERVSFYLSDMIKSLDLKKVDMEDHFVLYGAWNRPENYEGLIWFCENVLPKCDIRCVVVGGGMSQEVRDRVSSDRLTCTGFVENPYTYIAGAKCLLAPLFQGAGVKVKVIESLASGTPVIGTEIAAEGIPQITYNKDRQAVLIADDAESFIAAINGFTAPTLEDKLEIQTNFKDRYVAKDFKSLIS